MILTCAELCKLVYRDDLKLDGMYDVGDLRYIVYNYQGTTIVAIRGTANEENWLRDAWAFPKPTGTGHIAHAGFVRAFNALCEGGMMDNIRKDQPIVATGHSLGGAVATLLAAKLGCDLVTFGSPRVYFRFAAHPTINHLRYVCDDDVVPAIPRFLYSHTCEAEVLADRDDQIISIKDHSMDVYLRRLKKRVLV